MHERCAAGPLVGLGFMLVTLLGCADGAGVTDGDRLPWEGDFSLGPHPVGFRTATLNRTTPAGPREVALSVWYPAEADSGGRGLRVADYFRLVLSEGQLSETSDLAEEPAFVAAMTGTADALSPDRARIGLDAPVLARADAAPGPGPYPIVLWSSRHATVLAQAPLAEVLASHGFIVATAWSSDPPIAFIWEERSTEEKLATIQTQTEDLQQTLEELRRDPTADGDNVLVLAWSYGGQTAARLQEREAGVRGIVAMDANVVPARPEESLQLMHPLVYLVGRDTSGRGLDRLQRLDEPWAALGFTELAHGNFNALEGYLPAVLGTDTVYAWSLGGRVAKDGYRALVQVVASAVREMTREVPPTMSDMAALLEDAAAGTPIEVLTSSDRLAPEVGQRR